MVGCPGLHERVADVVGRQPVDPPERSSRYIDELSRQSGRARAGIPDGVVGGIDPGIRAEAERILPAQPEDDVGCLDADRVLLGSCGYGKPERDDRP